MDPQGFLTCDERAAWRSLSMRILRCKLTMNWISCSGSSSAMRFSSSLDDRDTTYLGSIKSLFLSISLEEYLSKNWSWDDPPILIPKFSASKTRGWRHLVLCGYIIFRVCRCEWLLGSSCRYGRANLISSVIDSKQEFLVSSIDSCNCIFWVPFCLYIYWVRTLNIITVILNVIWSCIHLCSAWTTIGCSISNISSRATRNFPGFVSV